MCVSCSRMSAWNLTGALSYAYEHESVVALCDAIGNLPIDAVYSEYSLPAIIAARAVGLPVYGSFSFTTQTSYASNPGKAGGLRKLLHDIVQPCGMGVHPQVFFQVVVGDRADAGGAVRPEVDGQHIRFLMSQRGTYSFP